MILVLVVWMVKKKVYHFKPQQENVVYLFCYYVKPEMLNCSILLEAARGIINT